MSWRASSGGGAWITCEVGGGVRGSGQREGVLARNQTRDQNSRAKVINHLYKYKGPYGRNGVAPLVRR